ncbi:AzlD domain-containing protein [uncultured Enterovirga sp.]|uniref:AzlD domain-containing protein n=1 Tax=uncultured Enterovirga sp. TaxID=2026352 RepID=UPI0035CC5409
MIEALWPYLVVLMVGALPNEVFRSAAVFLSRGLEEREEALQWIRIVALTLLAAVVSKILIMPPAALATVPLWVSVAAVAAGVAFFRIRPSLFLAILFGEALFVLLAWWVG